MHGVLAALAAAEEIDPATVRPSPMASVFFLILFGATVLLLLSFVRHIRRAQANLGSAREPLPTGPGDLGSAAEGDSR